MIYELKIVNTLRVSLDCWLIMKAELNHGLFQISDHGVAD